jgi:hypothetical protein
MPDILAVASSMLRAASANGAQTDVPHTARAWPLYRLAADSPRYTPLAVLLALATIPLLGALALDPRLFNGISVWVKPLKFLTAIILYLLTLAWFARHAAADVRHRPWWRWHERAVVCAIVLEMIWIAGAAALGTASHFNLSSPLAGSLYALMGVAAVLLTSASATLAWAIHRHPGSDLAPAIARALVLGLALTLPLTLATAGTLSAMGSHWIGGTPSDTGGLAIMGWSRDGGDLRVAHFFATHAMQAVPLAGLLCCRLFGRDALPAVHIAALAYAGFVT